MIRIILCLILGTITTVAVAWGITSTPNWPSSIPTSLDATLYDSLLNYADEKWLYGDAEALSAHGGRFKGVGSTVQAWSVFWYKNSYPDFPARVVIRIQSGWPQHALATVGLQENVDALGGIQSRGLEPLWIGGMPAPDWLRFRSTSVDGLRHAPPILLCPLWPGFVIDTLFYGAIWGGVFFGFTSAKRFIRARRGRCPRCGYDLRGNFSAGCSECGWQREQIVQQLLPLSQQ